MATSLQRDMNEQDFEPTAMESLATDVPSALGVSKALQLRTPVEPQPTVDDMRAALEYANRLEAQLKQQQDTEQHTLREVAQLRELLQELQACKRASCSRRTLPCRQSATPWPAGEPSRQPNNQVTDRAGSSN